MNDSQLPIALTTPGSREVFHALGDQLTVLLSGEQTGGAFTMVEISTPPGGGPPPHCHANEDEWFYILEGCIELWKDGIWTEVPAGTAVFLPRHIPHTYRNCGDTPLRMIVHAAPAGFEVFFAELAAVCAAPGGPDMQVVNEVAGRHGISFIIDRKMGTTDFTD
jgi:quercetin dioxygenase-like cupin family protein